MIRLIKVEAKFSTLSGRTGYEPIHLNVDKIQFIAHDEEQDPNCAVFLTGDHAPHIHVLATPDELAAKISGDDDAKEAAYKLQIKLKDRQIEELKTEIAQLKLRIP